MGASQFWIEKCNTINPEKSSRNKTTNTTPPIKNPKPEPSVCYMLSFLPFSLPPSCFPSQLPLWQVFILFVKH